MNICFLTSSFPRKEHSLEGIFILELAEYLQKRGHRISVVTPEYSNTLSEEKYGEIRIKRFKYIGWRKDRVLATQNRISALSVISLLWNMFFTAKKTIKEEKTDILHCFWAIPAGFVGVMIKKFMKINVVITSAGSDLNIWANRSIVRMFIKYTLRNTDRLITMGSQLKEKALLLGMNPSKVDSVLGNGGINLAMFKPGGTKEKTRKSIGINDEKTALYVGRLVYPKRVDILIRVMKTLKEKKNNYKLIIVGDGQDRDSLEALVKESNLSGSVLFMGEQPHNKIQEYMEASDIFVYASESEGLPTAIMEAMASGLPVVASAIGGIPDLIREGYNGYCIKDNDVMKFTDKINRLFENDELHKNMNQNAKRFAEENLSAEVIIPKIERLYESVL